MYKVLQTFHTPTHCYLSGETFALADLDGPLSAEAWESKGFIEQVDDAPGQFESPPPILTDEEKIAKSQGDDAPLPGHIDAPVVVDAEPKPLPLNKTEPKPMEFGRVEPRRDEDLKP